MQFVIFVAPALQTLFVPNSGNALKSVKLIPAMIESDRLYFRNLAGIAQLFGFQLIMVFPSA